VIPNDVADLRRAVAAYEAATCPKDKLESIQRVLASFEEDNRVELAAAPEWAKLAARSVASVWRIQDLSPQDGQVRLHTTSLADHLKSCPGQEPVFGLQPVPRSHQGGGTVFVVRRANGDLALLTAHHVARGGVEGLACVFGFHGATPPSQVPESDVIRLGRILENGDGELRDWALIEPTQPLDGVAHPALEVHHQPVLPRQEVFTLGFPFGVPMKFVDNARILSLDGFGLHTDLDTANGNSGSPVLAFMQGRPVVVGVIRQTPRDFEPINGCKVETPCKLTVAECAAGTIAVPMSTIPGLM